MEDKMRNVFAMILMMMVTLTAAPGYSFAGALMPRSEVTVDFQPTSIKNDVSGKATLKETSKGLEVQVSLKGVPEGVHGIHIHQNGSCGDQGNAAGGHFDPNHVQHGDLVEDGFSKAHAGDLGNIVANKEGIATLNITLPKLNLSTDDHYGVGGRAIILHEKEDNFGQPTGNAGGRIACGVIPES